MRDLIRASWFEGWKQAQKGYAEPHANPHKGHIVPAVLAGFGAWHGGVKGDQDRLFGIYARDLGTALLSV